MNAVGRQEPQPEIHIRPNKDCRNTPSLPMCSSSSKRQGLTKIAVIGAEQFVQ